MTDRVCINLSYAVPNDKAAEVEKIFSTHGKWMTEFYSDGTDHLLNAYFTKAPEFKDPTDPSKGETGSTLFTINEQFASMESVCLLYTSPSPRDRLKSRMPSSA